MSITHNRVSVDRGEYGAKSRAGRVGRGADQRPEYHGEYGAKSLFRVKIEFSSVPKGFKAKICSMCSAGASSSF